MTQWRLLRSRETDPDVVTQHQLSLLYLSVIKRCLFSWDIVYHHCFVSECPDGCQTCHEDEDATVICDECYEAGYVQDTDSDAGDCIGKWVNLVLKIPSQL